MQIRGPLTVILDTLWRLTATGLSVLEKCLKKMNQEEDKWKSYISSWGPFTASKTGETRFALMWEPKRTSFNTNKQRTMSTAALSEETSLTLRPSTPSLPLWPLSPWRRQKRKVSERKWNRPLDPSRRTAPPVAAYLVAFVPSFTLQWTAEKLIKSGWCINAKLNN